MFREFQYALPVILLPTFVFTSIYWGGYASFYPILVAFGLIPFIELFFKGYTDNLSAEEEQAARKKRSYDLMLYVLVPIQFVLIFFYGWRISFLDLKWYEYIGMTWSLGLACGIIGINLGHELGHRSKKYEQKMAKMLLLSSLYMHFFIEHNRGHHKNIATALDPATSRMNESLYDFWLRSMRDGWFSAWHLEAHRLQKLGISNFSWQNEMLRIQVYQGGFLLLLLIFFSFTGPHGIWSGLAVTTGFIISALVGALLLETVNYIEHYGLLRKEISPGRFEKVKPIHSWNSNHMLGRLLLFELTRHSDHHYNAGRKYQILRHFDDSPQMPTGYPGMMAIAFIPPLWFRIMNRQVALHNTRLQETITE